MSAGATTSSFFSWNKPSSAPGHDRDGFPPRDRLSWGGKPYGRGRWRGGRGSFQDSRSNPQHRAQYGRSFSDNPDNFRGSRQRYRDDRAVASDGYRDLYRNPDWETVTVDPRSITTSPSAAKLMQESHKEKRIFHSNAATASGNRGASRAVNSTESLASSTGTSTSNSTDSGSENLRRDESDKWVTVGHRTKSLTHPHSESDRRRKFDRTERGGRRTSTGEREGRGRHPQGDVPRGRGGSRVWRGGRGRGRSGGRGMDRGGSARGGWW